MFGPRRRLRGSGVMGELGRMDASELLVEAFRVGLEVRQEGDKLVVRGPKRHSKLAEALLAAKPAVLAALAQGCEVSCSRCGRPAPRVVVAYWGRARAVVLVVLLRSRRGAQRARRVARGRLGRPSR
jgi:hypothetical protein